MEGFKKSPKMQCFKEGGSVQREVKNFTKRDRKSVEMADTAQDKKVVKKAFAMHDKQEHDGEKTDLSKLKKGGRAKKELGTARKFIKPADSVSGAKKEPNKYKVGGAVGVYGAKKKSGDLDSIEKAKDIKPKLLCGGGKAIKKMADGGGVLDTLKNNIMGSPAQNEIAKQQEAKYLKAKMLQRAAGAPMGVGEQMATSLAGAGQQMQPAAPAPAAAVPAQKKGGKVKKMNTGGTCP